MCRIDIETSAEQYVRGRLQRGGPVMKQQNYTASHRAVRVSTRRFENSPYLEKYAADDMLYGIYAGRLHVLTIGEDPVEDYWKLRRDAVLYDVPEKPLEIKGPDAVKLLERVFCRRVRDLKCRRARYAIACTPQGGIQMDGVLMRMAEDHFWYVQADGEIESWLIAFSDGLDVVVRDPRSRVLQIQGPKSLDIIRSATNGQLAETFRYFHVGRFNFGGQEVLISRTGWTGEIGVELYSEGGATDHPALWDHLMAHGEPYGMIFSGATSLNTRRIEAGIIDNGTDVDRSMTPYAAGLGAFVDLDNPGFVGRAALEVADKGCRFYGLKCNSAVPLAGLDVMDGNAVVGRMTIGTWSPSLETGVGYVRFESTGNWLGKELRLHAQDDADHDCEVVPLPFFDPDKKIPRGLAAD